MNTKEKLAVISEVQKILDPKKEVFELLDSDSDPWLESDLSVSSPLVTIWIEDNKIAVGEQMDITENGYVHLSDPNALSEDKLGQAIMHHMRLAHPVLSRPDVVENIVKLIHKDDWRSWMEARKLWSEVNAYNDDEELEACL